MADYLYLCLNHWNKVGWKKYFMILPGLKPETFNIIFSPIHFLLGRINKMNIFSFVSIFKKTATGNTCHWSLILLINRSKTRHCKAISCSVCTHANDEVHIPVERMKIKIEQFLITSTPLPCYYCVVLLVVAVLK